MKKFLLLATILLSSIQIVFAEVEAVSPELKEALKVSANEPGMFKILGTLLFVVGLIYVTGVIYSKLNIVGAKTVQEQLKKHDLSNVVILSTTQLGQGKNLHIIELNKKRMLIGATQNSINLIRMLDDDETLPVKEEILEKKEKTLNDIQKQVSSSEEFDLHKKYLS
ncbi:MAG TPA: flagellar biosynthetic protein FliO [Candidatus Gastranaerophilaceae bacterium]|nr:flagellar biosynthetic protein FliO [Candidatus Gastranaerophilaceae bacterium]HPT41421.1 flagellar biosynthetic protein FliO [Candidatus Gastranaerophilaceae bacterium]